MRGVDGLIEGHERKGTELTVTSGTSSFSPDRRGGLNECSAVAGEGTAN